MIRRPPRSTRTDTLFPYTTLFRTVLQPREIEAFLTTTPSSVIVALDEAYFEYLDVALRPDMRAWLDRHPNLIVFRPFSKAYGLAGLRVGGSEERRVGKECGSTCRARWWPAY